MLEKRHQAAVPIRGGFRAPRRFIVWQTFFDFGDGQVKRNKRIDTHLQRRSSRPGAVVRMLWRLPPV